MNGQGEETLKGVNYGGFSHWTRARKRKERREERKEIRQKLREGKGICKGYEKEKLLQ